MRRDALEILVKFFLFLENEINRVLWFNVGGDVVCAGIQEGWVMAHFQ